MRLLLFLLCLQPALLAAAAPRVVASIAPLQEIAGALMAGIGEPQLIIENHKSAHHFAFKPSHMRRLQRADLVIWIDRHFEAGFNRVAEILPETTRGLELMPALGLDDHDGHIWYSPRLLQQSIAILAQTLEELDPENRSRYRQNANALTQAVADWRERIRNDWRNSGLRLLTDHAFLAHFAAVFERFEIASIQDHHAAHSGLKDLNRIEAWLRQKPAACLLTLEPMPSPLVARLANKHRLDIIDITAVTGAKLESSAIIQRLEQLEIVLKACQPKT